MRSFEQIRNHLLTAGFRLTMQEPYVACVELSLEGGSRHQSIFVSELDGDDQRPILRVGTVIAPTTGVDARRHDRTYRHLFDHCCRGGGGGPDRPDHR